jgi:hypothetical protein
MHFIKVHECVVLAWSRLTDAKIFQKAGRQGGMAAPGERSGSTQFTHHRKSLSLGIIYLTEKEVSHGHSRFALHVDPVDGRSDPNEVDYARGATRHE